MDEAGAPVLEGHGHLGGGKANDGQPHHGRFEDGQPQAGVANGVEEEAVTADKFGQFVVGHFAQAAHFGCAHADEIEWDLLTHPLEDVCTQSASAALQIVDDDDALFQVATVTHASGDHHTVIHNVGGAGVAVPHEAVELCDVDNAHVGIADEVFGVGRVFARRIVFDVEPWQHALRFGEQRVLVVAVVARRLEDDQIQIHAGDFVGGHGVHIVAPRMVTGAPAVAGCAVIAHRQDPLTRRLCEIVEITTVDMPGKHFEIGDGG